MRIQTQLKVFAACCIFYLCHEWYVKSFLKWLNKSLSLELNQQRSVFKKSGLWNYSKELELLKNCVWGDVTPLRSSDRKIGILT